ncbi:MAG: YtxH domain-containing protein [Crocinitomicaceae bacterium]
MEKSNNNTGKIVGAVLIGAAIGGALGILFAPNKGSVTRKKMLSKGEELKDTLQEKYDALLNSQKNNKEKTKV